MDEHKDHPKPKEDKTITLKEAEYAALLEDAKLGKEGWDKMLRNQADLENTRKRLDREKQEFIKFANVRFTQCA
jgi:molecular chaperone GrpE (heat shock protein)